MKPALRITIGLLSFIIGIALGSFSTPRPIGPYLIVILLLFVLWQMLFRRIFFLLPLITILTGLSYTYAWRQVHFVDLPYGQDTTFIGIISEVPDTRPNKTFLTIQTRQDLPSTKVQVTVEPYPLWQYGDEVRVQGNLIRPEPFDGFNYPLYLEHRGILALIGRPTQITLIEHNRGSPILASLYRLRVAFENRIHQAIPEPESSLLAGILLGSRQAIPPYIQEDLRYTGTSHIVAISGANITIVLGMLLTFLPIYSQRKQLYTITGISLAITLMTGASASVMRGALVACLGRWIRFHSRRAWPSTLLLGSMTLLLLGNPLMLVANHGFQLSFAAFAGLLYLGNPIKLQVNRLNFLRSWPEVLKSSLAETLAASIGTAPLALLLFHQFSLLGLIVNPLILWLLPLITFLGFGLILLGWIPAILSLIRFPLWLLLHAVLGIITHFARLSFGVIHAP